MRSCSSMRSLPDFDETGARSADDILWRRLRLGEIDAARAEMLKPVVTEQLEVLKKQQ